MLSVPDALTSAKSNVNLVAAAGMPVNSTEVPLVVATAVPL